MFSEEDILLEYVRIFKRRGKGSEGRRKSINGGLRGSVSPPSGLRNFGRDPWGGDSLAPSYYISGFQLGRDGTKSRRGVWNTGLESPVNPQTGKSATFLGMRFASEDFCLIGNERSAPTNVGGYEVLECWRLFSGARAKWSGCFFELEKKVGGE
jgi:hypothetical protein